MAATKHGAWVSLPSSFRMLAELSCRTEMPVFLLAIDWGSLSAPTGHPGILAPLPSHHMVSYFFKPVGESLVRFQGVL